MPNLRRSIVGDLSPLGGQFAGARGIFLQASDGPGVRPRAEFTTEATG